MRKIVRYDIYNGTIRNIWRYIVLFILCVLICVQAAKDANTNFIYENAERVSVSILDYYTNFFLGQFMEGVIDFDMTSSILLPPYWICLNICLLFIVSYYPERDLKEYCSISVLRMASRKKWWAGKCIWVGISTVFAYCIIFISGMLFSILTNHEWIWGIQYQSYLWNQVSVFQFFLMYVFVPVMTTFVLGMAQTILAFCFSTEIGFLAVITYLLISVYIKSYVLLGNNLMLVRNACYDSKGLAVEAEGIIVVVAAVVLYFAGRYFISKCNIFTRDDM